VAWSAPSVTIDHSPERHQLSDFGKAVEMSNNKKYWKGLDELHATPEFVERSQSEFLPEASANDLMGQELGEGGTNRRDFLKYLGFTIGAATLAACETPVTRSIPYLNKPEEVFPGVPNWYASTYWDGVDFCNVLVKTREGRPIKVIGNRNSKVSMGGINARVNSSVLSLYDSARAKGPMAGAADSDWTAVDSDVKAQLAAAASAGKAIVILSGTVNSPSMKRAVADFIATYPTAKHVVYDSLSASGILQANEKDFGVRVFPDYNFDKAEVIVSIGADFLASWGNSTANAVQYGRVRDVKGGKVARHYQFETNLSLSGSNADVRVAIKPSESGTALVALYNKLAAKSGAAKLSGGDTSYDAEVSKAAEDLWSSKGKCLVVCGSNSPADQTVANAINTLLGNYGATIDLTNPVNLRAGVDADMDALMAEMNSGNVAALIMVGVNPVYSHASGAKFADAIGKVKLSISTSDRADETAQKCTYLCPDNHYLESWMDAEPKGGHFALAQPTIRPLFGTRQALESILMWANKPMDAYSYIKQTWSTAVPPSAGLFEDHFNTALYNGFVEPSAVTVGTQPAFVGDVNGAAGAIAGRKGSEWELQLYVKAGLGDGSHANNPWLQELPDPISRVCWDNYVTMSPAQMKELGLSRLERGDFMADMVDVTVNGVTLRAPAYPQPGQKYGTIGLALGYGRTASGKCGNNIGVNAAQFITQVDGTTSLATAAVTVAKADVKYEIAATQTHHTLMGRGSILKETTFSEYKADPRSGNPPVLLATTNHGPQPPSKVNLWDDHPIELGHRWGMSIDLSKCIGCGACVTSCISENNTPVVGKEEVRRGRDMHWMRIDRYYSSDMTEEKAHAEGVSAIDKFLAMEFAAEAPSVAFQPVMCQHCNHAPCETVCPVAATTHSNEGLNQMAYNRCIGTRYCANNCPYKVRRFNWFQYHGGFNEFGTNPANDQLGRMVLNPDVVVRDRGVIEKCSFCVQNIQGAKLKAKKEGRKVKDEEVQSACAQVCPTNAIVFGDLNDTESRVAALRADERSYNLLEEVGVQPNVYYMTKVRNIETAKA
jgi:molybdopterin-containing oxidoreductase family iron-sulfur binding subunit